MVRRGSFATEKKVIGTTMRTSQTKSPYPASAFKSITCGLVVCLAAMLPLHVRASDEEAAWRISNISGLVRYTAHGTVVHGHKFGFVKMAGRCNVDLLWLTWSSFNPEVMKLVGSEVTFLIDVDGTTFKIGVNLDSTSTLIPFTTIALFTNFVAGPDFIELLSLGEKIGITISGPARELFDLPHDEFSLAGFAVARQKAKKACDDKWASNVAPLVFGSLEFPFDFFSD